MGWGGVGRVHYTPLTFLRNTSFPQNAALKNPTGIFLSVKIRTQGGEKQKCYPCAMLQGKEYQATIKTLQGKRKRPEGA